MEIVYLTQDQYPDWDEFCLNSDDAWFWHTTDWLEYSLNYKPSLKSQSQSFMVRQNNEIQAVCPLMVELVTYGDEQIPEFSFGGLPCSIPAIKNNLPESQRKKILKLVFDHIDHIAAENGVQRVSFRFSPLAPSFLESAVKHGNFLVRYGYIDVSLQTQIIDLNKTLEELWSDVRHGHRYDIGRGKKALVSDIFDGANIDKGVFQAYVDLHHKAAGRVTRPLITFDMMYEWIRRGRGVLAGVRMDRKYMGFVLLAAYKGRAYYASGCMNPEYPNIPVGHFLQWCIIKWLKEHDYRYYEIGFQQYGWLPHSLPSDKEVNIAKFKRGFGGFTSPLFISEKYYSKDYFVKIHTERISKYALFLEDVTTQGLKNPIKGDAAE